MFRVRTGVHELRRCLYGRGCGLRSRPVHSPEHGLRRHLQHDGNRRVAIDWFERFSGPPTDSGMCRRMSGVRDGVQEACRHARALQGVCGRVSPMRGGMHRSAATRTLSTWLANRFNQGISWLTMPLSLSQGLLCCWANGRPSGIHEIRLQTGPAFVVGTKLSLQLSSASLDSPKGFSLVDVGQCRCPSAP